MGVGTPVFATNCRGNHLDVADRTHQKDRENYIRSNSIVRALQHISLGWTRDMHGYMRNSFKIFIEAHEVRRVFGKIIINGG
jgi:hypothetical protein